VEQDLDKDTPDQPSSMSEALSMMGITRQPGSTLCLLALTLKSVWSFVARLLEPSLIGTHPVLLELIAGSTPAMITGGAFARVGQASLLLALLAPYLSLLIIAPLLWWAGRLWGPAIAKTISRGGPRAQRRTARAIRWGERYGSWTVAFSYFLPVPNVLIFASAGWTGMPFRRLIALHVFATTVCITTNVAVGYWIGRSAIHVAKEISHYGLILTLVLFVVMIVASARSNWRLAYQASR
jgi:membrane-associated protein